MLLYMYGIPVKRFDFDVYKNKKWFKTADFALGFFVALLAWVLFFNPVWWAAPAGIFVFCMAGIFLKIKRRYLFYGGLALVFFPFALWTVLMIFWNGRNEINS